MSEREERIMDGGTSSEAADVTVSEVDLNIATEEDLCELPGIGPALAARIVTYRSEVRLFEEPAEVVAVPGITEAMYEGMANRLTVASPIEEPESDAMAAVESESDLDVSDEESGSVESEEAAFDDVVGEAEVDSDLDVYDEDIAALEAEGVEIVDVVAAAEVDSDLDVHDEDTAALEGEDVEPGEPGEDVMERAEEPEGDEGPQVIAYTSPPQGGHWGRLFLFSLVGAAIGAILALAFLFMVNGTLNFQRATSEALSSEALRLDDEIDELTVELGELRGRVNVLQDLAMRLEEAQMDLSELSRDLGVVQSEVERLGEDMSRVQANLRTLNGETDRIDENVITLEEQVGAMGEEVHVLSSELDAMRQDAERFGAFLAGLQELLDQPAQSLPQSIPTVRPTSSLRPQITVIPLATPTP